MLIPPQAPGIAFDQRDWFPFPQRAKLFNFQTTFTFKEYIELIWRRRQFDIVWVSTYLTGGGSGTFENNNQNTAGGGPSDETHIMGHARDSYITPFQRQTSFEAPLSELELDFAYAGYSWSMDVFTPSFLIEMAGGVNRVTTDATGNAPSAVTCTFCGKSIPMFETSPAVETGSIVITPTVANGYWSWDGHWNTTTGAPIP